MAFVLVVSPIPEPLRLKEPYPEAPRWDAQVRRVAKSCLWQANFEHRHVMQCCIICLCPFFCKRFYDIPYLQRRHGDADQRCTLICQIIHCTRNPLIASSHEHVLSLLC